MIKKLLQIYKMRTVNPVKRAAIVKETLGVRIGEKCEVYQGVNFGSEPYLIEIGNNVRLTKGVTFITHDGGVWVLRNKGLLKNADLFAPIKVGNNVHIGINAVIMPGVTIGDNVIIGVGAVVTKDIPSNSIAVGVPARVIKTINDYYENHKGSVDYTKHMNMSDKKKYLLEKYKLKK